MKKRSKTIVTVLLILVIAIIISYPKLKPLFASDKEGPGGSAQPSGRPGQTSVRQALNVSGFLIQPVNMTDPYNTIGEFRPDEEVDLSFETSGKIVSINFNEGTRVKKGDLLAKINDKPLQAQLEKLSAQQKLAEAKEFRQKSLLGRDAISQESYDQIVTELQTIQADINLVRARISETELRAPFNGTIGLRYVSEGSYTNPSTKIAKLVKISPIKIQFAIPERYANEVRVGYPVTFTVDGTVYKASVYAIEPKIDQNTRTILLRAQYPNLKEEMKPGRFSSVTLLMSQINNAIAIPTEALVPEMEGEIVYVYKNGRAKVAAVDVGLRTESLIQVTKGLEFGDTLVTTGILQLRHDLPVVLDTVVIN